MSNDNNLPSRLPDQPTGQSTETHNAPPASRRNGAWQSLLFAVKAVEIRLRFVAVLVGIGLVIGYWDTFANYWDKWTRPTTGGAELSGGQEFYCPMHPSVVRDKPEANGESPKCPICGMPLSKRQKGEPSPLPDGVVSRVQLSPYRIQLAGVSTVEVIRRPLEFELRTVGLVAIDETRLSRIVLRVDGYIEKLYVNRSFTEVELGQPLAEVYSPQLYSSVQELLIARANPSSDLAGVAREKLKLLGVADEELDKIEKSGQAKHRLLIRSPQTGHIFQKGVVEGDRVQAGQMLFDVADLASVWIEAEVYEKDAGMLRAGQQVEATVDAFPDRVFTGKLNLIHPHVAAATRTNRVRFEVDNPGHLIRPGMYATVRLKTSVRETEPFATVARSNAKIAASDGAAPTDAEIVASQKVCPVTGAKLGSMGPPVRTAVGQRPVMMCCAGCESKIKVRPDYFLSRLTTVADDGVLAVPLESVIDTGNQQVVYVEREPGLFEGVAVTIGAPAGGYYPVIAGLLSGDRVAAAGAFLVDAETRLNPAAASAYFGASGGPSSSPGSDSSPSTSTDAERLAAEHRENLAKLTSADRKLAQQQRDCPITGKPLGSMGVPFKMMVDGKPVFLCCDGCQDQVNDDPQAALRKIQPRENP